MLKGKRTFSLIVVVLSLTLVFGAAGFGQNEGFEFKGSEDEVYYMVTFVSGVSYWSTVWAGFKQAAADLGVSVQYTGTSEFSASKQRTVFNQVLSKNPAGIAVSPASPDPFEGPINNAIDKGIPVMTFATDVPRSDRIALVTSDNVREGETAADFLAEAIGGEGQVAVMENPGQLNHEIRVNSFKERIDEEWPNVEVAAEYASNHDTTRAYTGLKQIVQSNPGLDAVFSPEASSAMGAARAAKELDQDIKIMNVDLNNSILDMIKNGDILAAIQPNTVQQGYLSLLTLFLAKHELIDPMNDWKNNPDKGPVEIPFVDNGLDIVTQDNVEHFYSGKYLEEHDMGSW